MLRVVKDRRDGGELGTIISQRLNLYHTTINLSRCDQHSPALLLENNDKLYAETCMKSFRSRHLQCFLHNVPQEPP